MNKQVLMACGAALALGTSAQAEVIPFLSTQFDVTVIASTADGTPGFDTLSGVLDDTVSVSTSSLGLVDIATAGAIMGPGLLTTSVDVSAGAIGNAVATAHFAGSFANYGPVSLQVDFSGTDFAGGSGQASTTLFVSLTSGGVTLFADYVQGLWQFAYTPLLGSTSVLDLTLSSDASAAFVSAGPGDASAFGLVTFEGTVPVPEAATWLMFSLGLGAVAGARLRVFRKLSPG